jgi:hypothetical protein
VILLRFRRTVQGQTEALDLKTHAIRVQNGEIFFKSHPQQREWVSLALFGGGGWTIADLPWEILEVAST